MGRVSTRAGLFLLVVALMCGCVRAISPSTPRDASPHVDSSSDSPVFLDASSTCIEGDPCDDDDPCTDNDRCAAGRCLGEEQSGFCRDRSFGSGGMAIISDGEVSNGNFALGAMAIQDDGCIVVGGMGGSADDPDFLVARLTSEGVLDPSFAQDGKLLIGIQRNDQVKALVLTPSGSIVVVGAVDGQMGVAEIDSAGVLNPSFGQGGKLYLDVTGGLANTLVRAPDGKLLLGGHARQATGQPVGLTLTRLESTGKLDLSFNQAGWLHQDYARDTFGGWVVRDAMGLLYLAGNRIGLSGSTRDVVISRYLPDGMLDMSWAQAGHYVEDLPGEESITTPIIGPGDTLYLVGITEGPEDLQGFITRLQGGALDPTFGVQGRQLLSGPYDVKLHAALLRPDGRLWVGGGVTDANGNKDVLLTILDTDGNVLATETMDLEFDDEMIWQLVAGPGDAIYAKAHVNDGVQEHITILRFYDR
ncbi:MAG: hypothetical protein JRH20_25585 [Deltaproteobacteria bacterium]|nr:hypothetical protein [Deltaproteobacteria bacterium]